jgi:hypothetical protein
VKASLYTFLETCRLSGSKQVARSCSSIPSLIEFAFGSVDLDRSRMMSTMSCDMR